MVSDALHFRPYSFLRASMYLASSNISFSSGFKCFSASRCESPLSFRTCRKRFITYNLLTLPLFDAEE